MWLLVLQRITLEFAFDIVYAPVWWYTVGIKRAILFAVQLFQVGNTELAPGLWLKNLFVPMYGQYDWQGRLMSFFMRVVNVIGRTIALLVWLVVCVVVFSLWLGIPVVVLWFLVRNLV